MGLQWLSVREGRHPAVCGPPVERDAAGFWEFSVAGTPWSTTHAMHQLHCTRVCLTYSNPKCVSWWVNAEAGSGHHAKAIQT